MSEETTILAGAVVKISATIPASFTTGSFATVAENATEVAGPLTLSGGGFSFETSSKVPLKTATTIERPGVKTFLPYALEMSHLPSDPGQQLYKELCESRLPFTLIIEWPWGETEYTIARGTGWQPGGGAAGEFRNASAEFMQDERGSLSVLGDASATFTLTYTAGANGSIIGNTPQTVVRGNDAEPVTAVPAPDYEFVSWSDGSTQNPRLDKFINGNLSVTATFALA
jgi:hypothetical protein